MTRNELPCQKCAPKRRFCSVSEHRILVLLVTAACARAASAAERYTPATESWNQPVPPFRIAGNVYYVGASEVSSYLFATEDGLILLDSGFAETVPQIERNIRALGFRV